jgi:hypothetical protein
MAVLVDSLSRSTTTTDEELGQIRHVEWRQLGGVLHDWLAEPVLDWDLPRKLAADIDILLAAE